MIANTIQELTQAGREVVAACEKKGAMPGLKNLLADLYPDKAHFIYELLQNAEDMDATIVRFTLSPKGLDFEHNGTKRDFNLADIDAITNIGSNTQKRDDPTSIGKFGVGFKSVFSYTQTPEVHSGKFDFRIVDYFVPETKHVPHIPTIDANGVSWTKFYFPFNNPKKPPDVALSEIREGLLELNDSTILFLRNIKRIEYLLPDASLGYLSYHEDEGHFLTILCKSYNEENARRCRWLRFQRSISIKDEQGIQKELTIAVAYWVITDAKTGKPVIVPVPRGGRTFIYFPAEKEYSGLRFNINAPFASTVARDSVRNCKENELLFRKVAELAADSLVSIKAMGLLRVSFFAVLPNCKDHLSFMYQYIFDYIDNAFQKFEYLPTKSGGYTTAKNAIAGPAELSNLLPMQFLNQFDGCKKHWIMNAPQKNSPEDFFIQSLGIEEFSHPHFGKLFDATRMPILELFLSEQTDEWLKRFYLFCAEAYGRGSVTQGRMKTCKMVRSNHGKLLSANEIFFLPVNQPLVTRSTPIVKAELYQNKGAETRSSIGVCNFLKNVLDIRDYGPRVEVEKKLFHLKNGIVTDENYFKTMLEFAKYNNLSHDLAFEKHKIFLYCHDGIFYSTTGENVVLGTAYQKEGGELIAEIYDLHCLCDCYKTHYSDEELARFLAFAAACGVVQGLKIEQCPVCFNPHYQSQLRSDARNTSYATDLDYTIRELPKLLALKSVVISKLIWDLLCREGLTRGQSYSRARFAPNASAASKVCESSLIYYLRTFAWLPDQQNMLHKPNELQATQLRNDFAYDRNNSLLKALGIGSAANEMEQKKERLEKAAAELGYELLPAKEVLRFKEWENAQQKERGIAPEKTVSELLKHQTRKKQQDPHGGDEFLSDGAVNHLQRRIDNIEQTFKNATAMKPRERKIFSSIIESTAEERNTLRSWYQGRCQMCNTLIMRYDHTPHFIARNIIDTRELTPAVKASIKLGWNSLCLCPNCAAKFAVCSKDICGLQQQILTVAVVEGVAERIVLTIELNGKVQEIHYIPKHFLALQSVIKFMDNVE